MPYDFFLSRYKQAYVDETVSFCKSLTDDTPVPCTGADGLVALIMAMAADKSAAENRWVSFREIVESVKFEMPVEEGSIMENTTKMKYECKGVFDSIKPLFC
jgi:myo-inositol 2-dehydrogenase/D-chiro-inositol 1-dehydrogenase